MADTNLYICDVNEHDRERTPKIIPSINATKISAQMIKINFIRTLEIHQRLGAIWGTLIEEKWLSE